MATDLAKALPNAMGLVQQMQPAIEMALPKHVSADRMVRVCLTMLRNTPKLALCTRESLLGSIIELAQLGLEPATPLGHAWIIPYSNTAQILIGYKGFIALADRAGLIVTAECVYAGDRFDYELGTSPYLKHRPVDDLSKRGEFRYAYATARWPDSRFTFKVCTKADIEDAQGRSAAWKAGQQNTKRQDSPWYTDVDAMRRKTAIRRLAPFIPMSPELARALQIDAAQEANGPPDLPPVQLPVGDMIGDMAAKVEAAKQIADAQKRAGESAPGTEQPEGTMPAGDDLNGAIQHFATSLGADAVVAIMGGLKIPAGALLAELGEVDKLRLYAALRDATATTEAPPATEPAPAENTLIPVNELLPPLPGAVPKGAK